MAQAPRFLRNVLLLLAVVLALLHASGVLSWRFVTQLELAIDDARTRAFLPHSKSHTSGLENGGFDCEIRYCACQILCRYF